MNTPPTRTPAMSEVMTLEMLRNAIANMCNTSGYAAGWVEAIDAHLAKAGVPVAYRWMKDGEAYSGWLSGEPDAEVLAISAKSGRTIEYAYSYKPAQPVEAVYALQLCITELLHDGVPTEPAHPRRVALTAAEAALAHPRTTVARKPCPGCNGSKGGLGANLGFAPCRDCDGEGFLDNDDDAPTGEQAGEVVVHRYYDAEVGISSASEWQSGNSGRTDAEMAERGYVIQRAYAQPRPMGVPDGWKLVPVEPTVAMLAEGRSENLCCNDDAERIYKAMLSAAPVAGGG